MKKPMPIFQCSGMATLAGVVDLVMGGVRSWRGKVRSLANLGTPPAAGAVIDAISLESNVRRSHAERLWTLDCQLVWGAAGCCLLCGHRWGEVWARVFACLL